VTDEKSRIVSRRMKIFEAFVILSLFLQPILAELHCSKEVGTACPISDKDAVAVIRFFKI